MLPWPAGNGHLSSPAEALGSAPAAPPECSGSRPPPTRTVEPVTRSSMSRKPGSASWSSRRLFRPTWQATWISRVSRASPCFRSVASGPGPASGKEFRHDDDGFPDIDRRHRQHRGGDRHLARANVTSSPDTGGLAVPAGRRSAERKTGLAVPGCGPAAAGPPPIAPEARWPGRRVEPDHLAVAGFGAPARQTGSPWWCWAPRPKRSGPATMGRGRRAAPASPRGTR